MGLASYILAIGKLKDMPEEALSYPTEFYAGIPLDTTIIGEFGYQCTNSTSRDLAYALLGDLDYAWDFGRHEIKKLPDRLPLEITEDWQETFELAKECLTNNIQLFFIPNG